MKKVLIIGIVLLFTIPVLGFEIDFDVYGKLGMAGWWMKSERFYKDTVDNDDQGNPIYGKDTIPTNTNIMKAYGGIGVKFETDRFGANIYLGIKMNTFDSQIIGEAHNLTDYKKHANFLDLKRWYLEWYINEYLTILAGQTEVPTCFYTSNQAFNGGTGMGNMGCLYTGRYPMFQFSVHDAYEIIEGRVAAIKVDTSTVNYLNTTGKDTKYHSRTAMPKFEGRISVTIDKELFAFNGQVAGGYVRYESVAYKTTIKAADAVIPVKCGVIGGDFGFKVGPVKLSYDVFYGRNIGTYGVWVGDEFGWWRAADFMRPFFPVHTSILDTNGIPTDRTVLKNGKALEMALILNVSPWDYLSFEAGMGGAIGDHEYKPYRKRWAKIFPDVNIWPFSKFNSFAWYVQAKGKIMEKLEITPEIGQYIYGPNRGFGRYLYWGFNTYIEL